MGAADAAVERLRAGGMTGDILPWRDVLHDGPVPEDVELGATTTIDSYDSVTGTYGACPAAAAMSPTLDA